MLETKQENALSCIDAQSPQNCNNSLLLQRKTMVDCIGVNLAWRPFCGKNERKKVRVTNFNIVLHGWWRSLAGIGRKCQRVKNMTTTLTNRTIWFLAAFSLIFFRDNFKLRINIHLNLSLNKIKYFILCWFKQRFSNVALKRIKNMKFFLPRLLYYNKLWGWYFFLLAIIFLSNLIFLLF